MTVELLKEALPRSMQHTATQELADKVNSMVEDPLVGAQVRENFVTYSKVLTEGKFKTEDYLNAVTYATYKVMGYSNKDSYARTFPDRYTALVAKGTSDKDISAYVAMYNKNKMVTKIMEQAVIPPWLLFQDIHHKAIQTQYEIMIDDEVSPKVRVEAANSLMTHLKAPESKKIEIDMSIKNEGGLGDLRQMMSSLAEHQLSAIHAGVPVHTIAAQKLGQALPAPTQNPIPALVIEDAEYVEIVPVPIPEKSLDGWEEPVPTYGDTPVSIDLDPDVEDTIRPVSLFS